ncbi:MAG: glycosyltransferase family 4 protein [Lachnospiraceae bacterium]|nr:glycosyltransferase family 4 protein [Lachnospiraceae bacterium]
MQVFLFRDKIDVGGLETLMQRMASWYKESHVGCIIVYKEISVMMRETFEKEEIVHVAVEKWCYQDWMNVIKENELKEVTTIFFGFNELLEFDVKRRRECLDIKVLLYITHPHVLLPGLHHTNKLIRKFETVFYKKAVERYIKAGNIIFMDIDTLRTTEEYYHIFIEGKKELIRGLPVFILKNDEKRLEERYQDLKSCFRILAVSRAEFPFKGYLLGLLRNFAQKAEKDIRLRLSLVTYGPDVQQIYDELANMRSDVRKRIQIQGKTENNKLKEAYYDAHIYVGMGTTVLEAANYSLPVITVKYYTEEFLTSGMFSEKPQYLAAVGNTTDGMKYIEKIMSLDLKDYMEECQKTKEALRNNYDADIIMKDITEWTVKKDRKVIVRGLKVYYYFLTVLAKMYRKIYRR